MSTDAPWLALAIDWMDSDMFSGQPHFDTEAAHGERLAWVCLLCWVKAQGRGGKAKVPRQKFAERFSLSMRAVEEMLKRAQKCASIEINGDFVSVCNWDAYQGKAASKKKRESGSFPETTSTKHQGQEPSTKDQAQPFASERWAAAWRELVQHRKEIKHALTPTASAKLLKKLAKLGEARAIQAIEHSIANGWQGIFEPDGAEDKARAADKAERAEELRLRNARRITSDEPERIDPKKAVEMLRQSRGAKSA